MEIRYLDFLESYTSSDEKFGNIESILLWIKKIRENSFSEVKIKPLSDLENWELTDEYNSIKHSKNSFFSIKGLQIESSFSQLNNIDHPIVLQKEVGILGFIVKKINGLLYFLVQAKIEPGNINFVQLSPTLQATKSNYTRKHGGKEPDYLSYFLKVENKNILFDSLQSEHSSRFYKKRNRNIIINVEEEIELKDNYKWMTLRQLKICMGYDNLVNMCARSVISLIHFNDFKVNSVNKNNYKKFIEIISDGSIYLNSLSGIGDSKNNIENIIKIFMKYKSNNFINTKFIPLNNLRGWNLDSDCIEKKSDSEFKIVGISSNIRTREVFNWDQPIISQNGIGIFGLIGKIIKNKLHVIVKIMPEVGIFDIAELGPTFQYINKPLEKKDKYYDFIINSKNKQILIDTIQSEEGGRFLNEQNRNIFALANDDFDEELLPGYIWIDLYQLSFLNQFNNILNIQLRNLIALF